MDVTIFLKGHEVEIMEIISRLKSEFNSHDFIEKFSKRFEEEYIDMLVDYKDTGNAFKTVHGQIARYLSVNKELFEIETTEKVPSEHVFGEIDYIQGWRKL
jgi:hypothetical protein